MKSSICTRLIAGILLPLVMVYGLFIVFEINDDKKEAVRTAQLFLRELTARFASEADGQFEAASQIAVGTADVLSLERLPEEKELYDLLQQNLNSHPKIVGSCIAFEPYRFRDDREFFAPFAFRTSDGAEPRRADVAVNYPAAGEKQYNEWPWYVRPRNEATGSWSEPYFGKGGSDTLMCSYSVPFVRAGQFFGVALIDISLDRIRRTFAEVTPDGVTFRLISRKGTFISTPLGEEPFVMKETIFSLAEKFDRPRLAEIGREMIAGKNDVVCGDGLIDAEKVWLAYAPLTSTGWSLMATIPEAKVMAPVCEQLYRTVLIFVLLFLFIAAIIVAASYRITRPIKRLALFAGELAGGNLDAKVGGVPSCDELGRLAAAFDRMTVDLKSNIKQRIQEESARKAVESELKVARRIQASLLPRIFPPFPDRKEFELHAMNEPASFIAGDFFDFFFLDENTLGIVMADVSGHGIPAAMFMAVSRTAIRNNAIPGRTPVEIISRVNTILSTDNDDSMFVTVFYGHYDVTDGTLRYVNAGHNPPYVLRGDGILEPLNPTGPFLAAFEDVKFEESRTTLRPGETLFTFTDGVTEAHTEADNRLFGEKRLEELLDTVRDRPVEEICNRVYQTVDEYSHGERHDDVTLLVLKRNI